MRQHITEAQRKALRRAHAKGLDPHEPGIHPAVLDVLESEDLIELRESRKGREVWKPSERGLELMKAQVPRFISRPHSMHPYANHPARAWRGEPEVNWA